MVATLNAAASSCSLVGAMTMTMTMARQITWSVLDLALPPTSKCSDAHLFVVAKYSSNYDSILLDRRIRFLRAKLPYRPRQGVGRSVFWGSRLSTLSNHVVV